MRQFASAFALAALVLTGITAGARAAEIEFEYQVHVADPPTHIVMVYKPGYLVTKSVHWSLEDAQERRDELNADGYTATIRSFHISLRWLNENSEYLRTFDDYEDALDFADMVEEKTGLYAWIKTVEGAKSVLIHDHVEHCLEAAMGPTTREQRATIEQFKKITRYL